jgi:hypothetical protein
MSGGLGPSAAAAPAALRCLAAMRRASLLLTAFPAVRSCQLSIIDRASSSARSRGPVKTRLAPSMSAGWMDTVHSFRSIRARTVYLISLYSIGRKSVAHCRVSLFKMDHSQTQKGATDMERGQYRPARREPSLRLTSDAFSFRLFGPANVRSYPTFPPPIRSELFDTVS